MANEKLTSHSYDSSWMPAVYDLFSSLIWLPESLDSIREQAIKLLAADSPVKVLELGCGTGGFTNKLLRIGATVTAIDRSDSMLNRARKTVPVAKYICCNILDYRDTEKCDLILFAFVLHELTASDRISAFRIAASLLSNRESIGIVEFNQPTNKVSGWMWRQFIRSFEPTSALDILDGNLSKEASFLNLRIINKLNLAGGRVQVLKLQTTN